MLYLIVAALLVALVWLLRRHTRLRSGISALASSIRERRTFLTDDPRLIESHPAWRELAGACSALVAELARLDQQQMGQLAYLKTTLGQLHESVLIVDRDNYIVLANKALTNMIEDAAPLEGRRLEATLRGPELFSALERARSGEPVPQAEFAIEAMGRSKWCEVTATLLPDVAEASAPWVLFVLHDISKQKQLESVRQEFVANVSHELKTPLSVIKGYAETLVDDHATMAIQDRERFLRTILRHAERLAAIVEDLLTLSRLEHESGAWNRSEVSVRAFLQAVEADFRERLETGGHRFGIRLSGEDSVVQMDLLRMHQVMANLLENAQKYTPPGSSIVIQAEVAESEVRFVVEDNGPGIPREDVARIFERFFRVEKGRSREKGGTGLGLSIVKHIIQSHGGKVWAESEAGEGTRIVFTLPREAEPGRVSSVAHPAETDAVAS